MAETQLQSSSRTTWLFEKRKTVYVGLGQMAKWRDLQGVPVGPWVVRCLGEIFIRPYCANQTILHKLTSPIQRRTHKGKDTTIYITGGVSTMISKRHFYHKDQVTKMQRKHWLICRKQARQEFGILCYPKSWKATLAQSVWSFNATVSWLAEHKLVWIFRRRTPSADIIFFLDTKFTVVDFVLLDFELASARLERQYVVWKMVR